METARWGVHIWACDVGAVFRESYSDATHQATGGGEGGKGTTRVSALALQECIDTEGIEIVSVRPMGI